MRGKRTRDITTIAFGDVEILSTASSTWNAIKLENVMVLKCA